MFRVCLVFLMLVIYQPATAQVDSNYAREFEQATSSDRVGYQMFLIAGGYLKREYDWVLHEDIWWAHQALRDDLRTFGANGITREEMDGAIRLATPILERWRFKSVQLPEHPGVEIIVPTGLGLYATRQPTGVVFSNGKGTFRLKFIYLSQGVISDFKPVMEREFAQRGSLVRNEMTSDKFVMEGSNNRFLRFHASPQGGIIGIDMTWADEDSPVYGSRLKTMVSSYLRASINGDEHVTFQLVDIEDFLVEPVRDEPEGLPHNSSLPRISEAPRQAAPPTTPRQHYENSDERRRRVAIADYDSLPPGRRFDYKIHLVASGFLRAEYARGLNLRTWQAHSRLRQYLGIHSDVNFPAELLDGASRIASPVLQEWGLRSFTLPNHRGSIVLPLGLDLVASEIPNGVMLRNANGSLQISFKHIPKADTRRFHDTQLAALSTGSGRIVRDASSTNTVVLEGQDGRRKQFLRYHEARRGGLIGFEMTWSDDLPPVYGDRLKTMISSYFRASVTDIGTSTFPRIRLSDLPFAQMPRVADAPPREVPPRATPRPSPRQQEPSREPGEPHPRKEEGGISFGSGFFVSSNGLVVTNAHVVEGCSSAFVVNQGETVRGARIVARDDAIDLALIATNQRAPAVGIVRNNVALGEEITVFGFPHVDILDPNGVFTVGHKTAERGIGGDPSVFQISAGVQSGNSGGPVLDRQGRVVGVVVAQLNWRAMVESGDLPQNVNFAISARTLLDFLDRAGFRPRRNDGPAPNLMTADVADRARDMSVLIVCEVE